MNQKYALVASTPIKQSDLVDQSYQQNKGFIKWRHLSPDLATPAALSLLIVYGLGYFTCSYVRVPLISNLSVSPLPLSNIHVSTKYMIHNSARESSSAISCRWSSSTLSAVLIRERYHRPPSGFPRALRSRRRVAIFRFIIPIHFGYLSFASGRAVMISPRAFHSLRPV